MPTIFLSSRTLSEGVKNEKHKFFVRTVVEIYGTPMHSINEIVNMLQFLKFMNQHGDRRENLEFLFVDGTFRWMSNTSIVDVRGKKDSIYEDDVNVNREPVDDFWNFTILPHIVDLIIGKKWRMVSCNHSQVVFWMPEPRKLPNPNNMINPLSSTDLYQSPKARQKKKRSKKKVSFFDENADPVENSDSSEIYSPKVKKKPKQQDTSDDDETAKLRRRGSANDVPEIKKTSDPDSKRKKKIAKSAKLKKRNTIEESKSPRKNKRSSRKD
eukprot:TRINITY_DN5348_c0_g1_i1.p1 TRINITY_DN5348_c0_g1~~TRINITY_DN5348_c0_g1_i1.p1  ORF type:complete len:295 (-),score=60.35 TRINITY_DN5348_c0_g1_i1:620-1426(-)